MRKPSAMRSPWARTPSLGAGNGSAVTFATTLDGARNLTINTIGTTTFGGVVGGTTALTSLTTKKKSGTTAINGGAVTTTAAQDVQRCRYPRRDNRRSKAWGVTFSSTLDGAMTLAINDSGTTTFTGAVGSTTALASLTTNATGTTAINGGAVTTSGAQSYGDAVTLGADNDPLTGAWATRFSNTVNGPGA